MLAKVKYEPDERKVLEATLATLRAQLAKLNKAEEVPVVKSKLEESYNKE